MWESAQEDSWKKGEERREEGGGGGGREKKGWSTLMKYKRLLCEVH